MSTMGRRRRALAFLVVGGLAAAGCSSRDSSTSAATTAAPTATTVAAAGGDTTVAATGDTTATTEAGTTTTAAPAPGPGDFGSLKDVCGAGDAKGATDQGVTDTEITMGSMSDPGNAIVPGLNQEMFDAATAFVGWCNAAGGILGRKINLNLHDAKLFEAGPAMTDACQKDFMLAGNGVAFDATVVDIRVACHLPEIPAFDVSSKAGRGEGSIQAIPVSDHMSKLSGLFRAVAAIDPEAIKHYGLLSSQTASIRDSGDRDRAAAAALGYVEVHYEELPNAVDNWAPIAQNIQNDGVQVLGVQPTLVIPLMKAFNDLGYFPKYILLNANNYASNVIDELGPLLDKTTFLVNNYTLPVEDATNPLMKEFIDIHQTYAKVDPKGLGFNSFSAFLLWAQGAKACGSELTRQCVLDNVSKVKAWTAGGLHAPHDPSNSSGSNSPCYVAMQATPKGFVVDTDVTKPDTDGLYNCDPKNIVDLPGFPKPEA